MQDLKVYSYAGYKYPEKPRSFIYLGRRYEVSKILSSSQEERGGERILTFKVKTEEGEVFHLAYSLKKKEWFLI
jgi:hypothetical protein